MCHRYNIKTTGHEVEKTLGIGFQSELEFPQGDVYPLANVPVVIDNNDQWILVPMSWGLLPKWWRSSDKYKKPSAFQRMTFNARSETIDSKPSFRDAFKQRRCLVPATEFYEGPKGSAAYFGLQDSDVMFFAGLWESWRSKHETVESCTIVTTEANDLVAKYHPRKRMPVILPDSDSRSLWMSPNLIERSQLDHLFQPLSPDMMAHREVDN